MITFKKRILFPIVSTVLISPAFAAELDQIETVTVTANKIEENINDVPQSITLIDKYKIEEKGITSVVDIMKEIPNMTVSTGHYGVETSFRGLTPSIFTSNNPIVVYIDGVATTSTNTFDASMANVERVEVLRGPQGTLYGKDAIGGVINIVTKEPTNDWSGDIGAEYGSNNHSSGTFNTSGALINNKLFIGVNGQGFQDDGWIENTYSGMNSDANSEEDKQISAFLLYKPTEKLKIKLNVAHQESISNWFDGYKMASGTDISEFNRDDAEKVSYDVDSDDKKSINSQALNISYQFNKVLLESIITHQSATTSFTRDADFSDASSYAGLEIWKDGEDDTWTQEMRLSSNNSDGLRWIAGLYFDLRKYELSPYGMQFPFYGSDYEMNAESVTDSFTQAVFGQVVTPFMDRFEFTLGVRAQKIKKEFDLDTYYQSVGSDTDPYYELTDETTWNDQLFKAALNYEITSNWNSYISFSQGYMPGGYNDFAMNGDADDNSFDPETSDNYEIGIKGEGKDFTVSASLFRMNIKDIHVFYTSGSLWLTDNAKKAHSQGLELSGTWYPTDTLELSGAIGLLDAKYDDYNVGTVQYDGDHIAGTAKYNACIGVTYTDPSDYYLRLDLNVQGDTYYLDNANSQIVNAGSYIVSNFKVGYNYNDWNMYGYINNLTDEEYITDFRSSSSFSKASFGNPRTFGIGMRYHL